MTIKTIETVILSDLHLTGDPATSEMQADDIEALCEVIDTADRLLIAGDMEDGWQCDEATMRAWWRREDGQDLHMALLYIASHGTLGILAGNHDSASYLRNTLPGTLHEYVLDHPAVLDCGGVRIWVEHGHRGDFWNHGTWSGIGHAVSAVGGALERLGWHDVDLAWERLWGKRYRAAHGGKTRDTVERWASRRLWDLRRLNVCDCLVFGHTHRAGVLEPGLYNCGTWCGGRRDYVEISDSGEVTVHGA